MYKIKNKLSILIINLLVFTATNVNAKKIPLKELSVGNTLNINSLNLKTVEKIGDLFNGYNGSKYIKNTIYPENNTDIVILRQSCLSLKSLRLYSYQEVWINDGIQSHPLSFNYLNINNLGIPKFYFFSNHYFYGIVKICRLIKSSELDIKVIDEDDLLDIEVGINYKILFNTTAVFRLKQNNETHYVSSITFGNCVYQVYVNDYKLCNTGNNMSTRKINNFFESALYSSFITSADNNFLIDNSISEFYFRSDLNYTLHSFANLTKQTQLQLFKRLGNDFLISLELRPLLKLPLIKKQLKRLTVNHKILNDLEPGDIINENDLEKTDSPLNVDHILSNTYEHYPILPFITYNFTDCINYDKNREINFNKTSKSYEKINVFEEIAKKRYYGVKREYLNESYKCIKTVICSELNRRKLEATFFNTIDLNEKMRDGIKYIFDGESVLLSFGMNKTHYVTRTERGECLFQALLFSAASNDTHYSNPEYTGRIISASNNTDLENRIEKYLDERKKNLFNVREDILALISVLGSIKNNNNTLINIYLDRI